MNAVVFENRNGSALPVILAFGVSVFGTDALAAAANRGTEPYLTARTLRAELSDPASPILRPSDIARRFDSPLNILILHYCETPSLEPERAGALRYQVMQEFLDNNRGYRIAEVLIVGRDRTGLSPQMAGARSGPITHRTSRIAGRPCRPRASVRIWSASPVQKLFVSPVI